MRNRKIDIVRQALRLPMVINETMAVLGRPGLDDPGNERLYL
jgi:hypothetical protein